MKHQLLILHVKSILEKLDEKLNFNTHVKEKITKANKGIGVIRKLAHVLPRESLITIYKTFVRPHIMAILSMINLTIVLFVI